MEPNPHQKALLDLVERHAREAASALRRRDEAIAQCHRLHVSAPSIAKAAGLTKQGVHHILRRDGQSA